MISKIFKKQLVKRFTNKHKSFADMVLVRKDKPGRVIADYYEESRERFLMLERNRKEMERILGKVRQPGPGQTEMIGEELKDLERDVEDEATEIFDDMIQDDREDIVMMNTNTIDSVAYIEEDDIEVTDDEDDFALWLRSISQCLSNKICDDPVRVCDEESEEEDEDIEDDERSMKVVKSVFDEETATNFVKTYLQLLKVFNI